MKRVVFLYSDAEVITAEVLLMICCYLDENEMKESE